VAVSATVKLWAYISGAWVELDSVQPASSFWGRSDNGPLDFVADVGELKFNLDNSGGLYTPGGPSALAGFKRGVRVKLVVTFEGEDYVRDCGYIAEIEPRPSNRDKTISITCLDWMDYAARHPIVNPGIMLDEYAEEVINTVVSEIEIQPAQTDYTPGAFRFQSALDTVDKSTTAYSEFAKIASSDITHIYLRKDKTNGETLVLENADTRHGWVTPTEIPLVNADSDTGLWEDGDDMLWEDGDTVLWNEVEAVTFDGTILTNFEAPYGAGVVNRMPTTAYPRRYDTSPQILFQLDEPFEIAQRPFDSDKRGRNYLLEGTYADPEGGAHIGARDVITPVITTDYLMNSQEDGLGVDISSSLYIDIRKGSEGFTAFLANTNATYPTAYVTKFNVRGTGLYQYNPVTYTAENEDSIAENEAQEMTLHQKYRGTNVFGSVYAKSVVEEYGDARTRLQSVTFCANKSGQCMMAFLHTDVGDVQFIEIPELSIESCYYIQGVEAKYDNGLIWVTWFVKEAPSIQGGMTAIAMEFDGTSTGTAGDAVDFDGLPRVSAGPVTERTFAAWINLSSTSGAIKAIIAPFADSGGVMFYATADTIALYSNRFDVSPGDWNADTTVLTTNTWFHVVATYNHSATTNDAAFYINGIPQTVVEALTPAGSANSELGTHVVIGNIKTVTEDYTNPFAGKIFDPRIYDRIITADEALTLYNSGTPDPSLVTDGLVFQPFVVRTDRLSEFVDVELDADTTVFENQFRSVGFVHGSPIARAAP
jgi:hypothetical protein